MVLNDIKIGVCGAGAMGAGIAQIAASAGHQVFVLDRDEAALQRGRNSVAKGCAALLKRGKIDQSQSDALQSRIKWTLGVADLAPCGLVIEAIIEDMQIKQALFSNIEGVIKPDAILATNTSSLPVTALAASLKQRSRFMGLHFFNPAPIMKLVEIISGEDTDKDLLIKAKALMESWGKVGVIASDVPGFIVNRLARPFYSEGWRAYSEGVASASSLDHLYRELGGFRMGPLELGDLIGHDINHKAATSMRDAYYGKVRFIPSVAQGQLVSANRLGRKSGEGVYDYTENATKPEPDLMNDGLTSPSTDKIIELLQTQKELVFIEHHGCLIGFSEGRPASLLRMEYEKPVILFDWVNPAKPSTCMGFSVSCDDARQKAVEVLKELNCQGVELLDRPGLVVLRTWLQLVNAAADAIGDKVAGQDDIDLAMRFGVNYPAGPMQWANSFGMDNVINALNNIADETGEELYRPSATLKALSRQA